MKTFISSSILALSAALVVSGSPVSSSASKDAAASSSWSSSSAAAASITLPVPMDNKKYRVTKTLTSTTTIHRIPTGSADPPSATTSTRRNILPVASPAFLPEFDEPEFGALEDDIPTGPISRETEFNLEEYPALMAVPDTDHEGVQAAIEAIDWDHVPDIPVRKLDDAGEIDMTDYDVDKDESCWWSATQCLKPKIDYVPEDIYMCSNAGEWGLTFDDGPLNPRKDLKLEEDQVDPFAEPRLYDFLAETKQKATLFYVGSNVVTFPDAAKRGFQSGHGICLHTWSHSAMTTLTNEQIVAELYWALRAVKHATGVTSRCWRPPYGDVDDRVRAIAHQMGLATVLWDLDSEDWKLPSSAGNGLLKPEVVDGYFTKWIEHRKIGNDTEHGHIGLQHEINEATVGMAEKWLPKLQEVFNVKPIHECTNLKHIYWEQEVEDEKDEKDHDHDDDDDDDHDHDHDHDDDDDDDDDDDHDHDHDDDDDDDE